MNVRGLLLFVISAQNEKKGTEESTSEGKIELCTRVEKIRRRWRVRPRRRLWPPAIGRQSLTRAAQQTSLLPPPPPPTQRPPTLAPFFRLFPLDYVGHGAGRRILFHRLGPLAAHRRPNSDPLPPSLGDVRIRSPVLYPGLPPTLCKCRRRQYQCCILAPIFLNIFIIRTRPAFFSARASVSPRTSEATPLWTQFSSGWRFDEPMRSGRGFRRRPTVAQ